VGDVYGYVLVLNLEGKQMEIIIGILGLLIAIITFYFSYFKEPKEEIDHLKVQFRATQSLSKEVQNKIEKYATKTNSWDKLILPNITFEAYLKQMKEAYDENLSDELFKRLFNTKLTKPNIQSMTKSLETQFSALQQMNTQAKVLLDQINE